MLSRLQAFFSHLTARQAFSLFAVALLTSAFLIFENIGEPLSPSLPVILYGSTLFYCQKKFFLTLNTTVKDSPYFLGFILTLLGLMEILNGGLVAQGTSTVVPRVGAAILPTVFGIFFRQLLLSWDSSDAYFDREYQSIADGLRTDAAKFRDAQARFVGLVTEFVKTREELLSGEEKVFGEYVAALKEGTSVLAKIQRNYPKRIDGLLEDIAAVSGRVSNAASSIEATVTALTQTYAREFEENRRVLAAARSDLENQAAAAQLAIGNSLSGFAAHAEGLRQAAASHVSGSQSVRDANTKLAEQIAESSAEVSHVVGDLKRLAAEVKAIDEIIGDLINLLSNRVRELRAE